jgi:hypothetical protein
MGLPSHPTPHPQHQGAHPYRSNIAAKVGIRTPSVLQGETPSIHAIAARHTALPAPACTNVVPIAVACRWPMQSPIQSRSNPSRIAPRQALPSIATSKKQLPRPVGGIFLPLWETFYPLPTPHRHEFGCPIHAVLPHEWASRESATALLEQAKIKSEERNSRHARTAVRLSKTTQNSRLMPSL